LIPIIPFGPPPSLQLLILLPASPPNRLLDVVVTRQKLSILCNVTHFTPVWGKTWSSAAVPLQKYGANGEVPIQSFRLGQTRYIKVGEEKRWGGEVG